MICYIVATIMMLDCLTSFVFHVNVIESQVLKQERVFLSQRKFKYLSFLIFINMIQLIITHSKLYKLIGFNDFLCDFF